MPTQLYFPAIWDADSWCAWPHPKGSAGRETSHRLVRGGFKYPVNPGLGYWVCHHWPAERERSVETIKQEGAFRRRVVSRCIAPDTSCSTGFTIENPEPDRMLVLAGAPNNFPKKPSRTFGSTQPISGANDL